MASSLEIDSAAFAALAESLGPIKERVTATMAESLNETIKTASEQISTGGSRLFKIQTAGDAKVCPTCTALAEASPYTAEEVAKLLPKHGNCRCTAVPWREDLVIEYATDRNLTATVATKTAPKSATAPTRPSRGQRFMKLVRSFGRSFVPPIKVPFYESFIRTLGRTILDKLPRAASELMRKSQYIK